MTTGPSEIPTSAQRAHLEKFLEKLEEEHLQWYERQQTIHYWTWIGLEVISIFAPAAATLIAAISMAHDSFDQPSTKTWLTVLPVVATVSSSLLARLGAREMEQTREIGRQQVEYLLERARVDLQTAKNDEELIELRKSLIEKIEEIDIDQNKKTSSSISGSKESR